MYKIVASYKQGSFKKIDTASSEQQAKKLTNEYRISFGNSWRVIYYNTED